MRFALLGDHPDGLDVARALAESGRHELTVYSGPAVGAEYLARWGLAPRRVGDVEEALADAAVDSVIVAAGPGSRAALLRRALQAECHVLCVHPADDSVNVAYEASLIQGDTGRVLLPLLPEALHPGVRRLAELARAGRGERSTAIAAGPGGANARDAAAPRLVELERWSTEELLLDGDVEGHRPGLPGWDVLRLLGGEVAEVFALADPEELLPGEPLVLSGRFVAGGLWQATYLPGQASERWRLSLVGRDGRVSLVFPDGWPGESLISYTGADGQARSERFAAINLWAALVEEFEDAVELARARKPSPGVATPESLTNGERRLGWQDELRALELDDAARRSVERRRSSTLDHQEATEEASFKGTMTLVGCSLIWLSLLLLILSAWVWWLAWLIVPVFAVFLVLQGLRWVVPAAESTEPTPPAERTGDTVRR